MGRDVGAVRLVENRIEACLGQREGRKRSPAMVSPMSAAFRSSGLAPIRKHAAATVRRWGRTVQGARFRVTQSADRSVNE